MQKSTFLLGVVIWLVPMFISTFLFDPLTKSYVPNFPIFMMILISVLFGLTHVIYHYVREDDPAEWFLVATVYTLTCSILDIILLVCLYNIDFMRWLSFSSPSYILIFFGLGYFKLRRRLPV